MSSALIILAVVTVAVAWLCSGLLLGQALRYRARLRDAEAESAAPRYAPLATVIAPCRGVDAAFETDILALLRQDYPAYEVIFVTGSCDEPAHARLTQILARGEGRARLTVAGPAAGRSQKVHNQLHALQLADETSEVFVFVDSDGRTDERFLRHLVAPLADTRVGAATGYRWFVPPRRGTLEILAALWGAVVASAQAEPQFAQLWGGAMAIRRERFVTLAVAQAWAGASTDDDALTRILRRAALRIAFVPQCYVLSTCAGSLREFMAWGMRQLLFMRVYLAGMWRLGFAMTAVTALTPVTGLLALMLAATVSARGLLIWGLLLLSAGVASAVSNACVVRSTERFLDTLGRSVPRLAWSDFLAYLPGAWVFLAHFIQSALTRRVAWQGVTYELLGPERTVLVNAAKVPGT